MSDLDSILAIWSPQHAATMHYLDTLTPAQRADRRPFPWDVAQMATIEDIVWHVVSHEQHHRGQLFTRLTLLGRRDLPDYDLVR